MFTLTENQQTAVTTIGDTGATAQEVADALGYQTTSGVYDLFKRAERRGWRFESENGVWFAHSPEVATDGGVEAQSPRRTPPARKQSITRSANDFLADLEEGFRARLAEVEPARIEGGPKYVPGGMDMVMFRTDDHFGGYETTANMAGETVVVWDSDMAEDRIYQHLEQVLTEAEVRRSMGENVENITVLMNGDHVTNESIYKTQPHHIDSNVRQQIRRCAFVYVDVIRTLADHFDTVTVVSQHGNHGEFRADGASEQANADDLLIDSIDLAIRTADFGNVRIITNHVDTHTNFMLRDRWMGHMRHGQGTLGHIGTNSGVKRWQSYLLDAIESDVRGDPEGPYPDLKPSGFDVGYVGHYHELKLEPVAGRPVLMGGTLQPGGDYENSIGIAPGRPGAWTHGVTDDEPVAWLSPVYFDGVGSS